ncbi:MAG TPA: CatB-related O-acetyltransferase [Chitinophagaceae bacterium]|nr:CatB-related O-acetyltransferase [Chitinophagaceae bacterium]
MGRIKKITRNLFFFVFAKFIPELNLLRDKNIYWPYLASTITNSNIDKFTKLLPPYKIRETVMGEGTYMAPNGNISFAEIGKYCSIGPNFLCGWGIHPTNGISTSPMFYSTLEQNGRTLSATDKIEERKKIIIGNDVFIGANVTILDGVIIGDGAVIGAGSIVSKDIPPYAIAVGCPIKVTRFRFAQEQIDQLMRIQWWNLGSEGLKDVEKYFFDVELFIEKYDKNISIEKDTL